MDKLQHSDLYYVLTRTPKYVRTLLAENAGRAFLAGGFIRATIAREKANDIDLFGPDKETLEKWAKDVVVDSQSSARLFETDNAFTVLSSTGRLPLQFIHRWTYTDPDLLLNEFDFSIAQAVIWAEPHQGGAPGDFTWQSKCSDYFYSDLAAKRLRYQFPRRAEDAGGSLMRVRKFLSAGYTIQAPSLAGVISRLIGALDFSRSDMADEQWRTQVLTGLLREVDPMLIVDGIDIADEHEFAGA